MATPEPTYVDLLEQRGKADRAVLAPAPDDDELVRLARQYAAQPGVMGTLPAETGADLLIESRAAYDRGRHPDRLDFGAVVRELSVLGVPAHVERLGEVAILYAGQMAARPDRTGTRRRTALLGPGGFAGPEDTGAYGRTTDLEYGPADGGQDACNVAEHARPGEVAARIAEVVRDAESRRARLADVLAAAVTAFWQAAADGFPEVDTDDPRRHQTHALDQAMRTALQWWLIVDRPTEGIAPTRAAAGELLAARRDEAVARLAPIAEEVTDSTLWDLITDAAHVDAERHAARDFAPIGDDIAARALRDRADDLVNEARQAGVTAGVDLLVDLIGEQAAHNALVIAHGGLCVACKTDGDLCGARIEDGEGWDGQCRRCSRTDTA